MGKKKLDTELTFNLDEGIEAKLWVNKEDWDMQMNFKKFQEAKWWRSIPQDMIYEEYTAQQQPKCSSNE